MGRLPFSASFAANTVAVPPGVKRKVPMKNDYLDLRGERFGAGQAVVLSRGALAGFTGLLLTTTDDRRCLIRLDGAPQGVLLTIEAVAVARRRGESIDLNNHVAPVS